MEGEDSLEWGQIMDVAEDIDWDPKALIRRMNLTLYFSLEGWEYDPDTWKAEFTVHKTIIPVKSFTSHFLKTAERAGFKKEWFGRRELQKAMDWLLDNLNAGFGSLKDLGIKVAAKKIDISIQRDSGPYEVHVDEDSIIEDVKYMSELEIHVKGNKVEMSLYYDESPDAPIPGKPQDYYPDEPVWL
jgi:hypothetical protein